ncbi:unnamed protein product, partial [Polarella glacialis]
DQQVCSLSGGEKARVAFAQFLLQPCALLVLDEPTNHLDISTRELLEDAIKAFDGAALVVSHDRFFLREFATRVLEVVDGGLRDHDSWESYSSEAPAQWHQAENAEVDFLKQDAIAAVTWSNKKMARLKKNEGIGIGLRRLSPKAKGLSQALVAERELVETREEAQKRRLAEQLISQGLDPALLGSQAPGYGQDD